MSQDTESTVIIDKKEMYRELLQKVIPFTKSDNEVVKRAAYDFNIILKCAINDSNSSTLTYLNQGIEHAIEYFTKNLLDLINNRIDPETNFYDTTYGLINDIAKILLDQLLYRNKLKEFKTFLMEI